ncbi:MAG TPA: alpha/beta hydrolase [Candidatus Polarisedimenticolaceae bacterium]
MRPRFRRAASAAIRWSLRAFATCAAVVAAIAAGFLLYALEALPPLQPWHTERLEREFDADRDRGLDLDGYRRLEEELFAGIPDFGARAAWTRWDPNGQVRRLAGDAPWNRTFRVGTPGTRGAALLVHGLTDSPYAMGALARVLAEAGYEATVLRLPGHGALPSGMVRMRLEDWQAAVRIAARDVAARVPPGGRFVVGGFSTGGALTLQYTLDTQVDASLRRPDGVVLVSPAIAVSPLAALSNAMDLASILPWEPLQKSHWQEIKPEFDPYKFNSFAVNAIRQVRRTTLRLQASLADAQEAGRLGSMPPVLAFQSAIDATVGTDPVVDLLFARLSGAQHRLVLFDVNRYRGLGTLQRPETKLLIDRAAGGPRGYSLTVIANRSTESPEVEAREYTPGSAEPSARPLDLAWPAGVVSLGHVALPFPPDDPVYGFLPGSGANGVPSLGSWALRGEEGAITLPLGALTRLRSNPFWQVVVEEVGRFGASGERP